MDAASTSIPALATLVADIITAAFVGVDLAAAHKLG